MDFRKGEIVRYVGDGFSFTKGKIISHSFMEGFYQVEALDGIGVAGCYSVDKNNLRFWFEKGDHVRLVLHGYSAEERRDLIEEGIISSERSSSDRFLVRSSKKTFSTQPHESNLEPLFRIVDRVRITGGYEGIVSKEGVVKSLGQDKIGVDFDKEVIPSPPDSYRSHNLGGCIEKKTGFWFFYSDRDPVFSISNLQRIEEEPIPTFEVGDIVRVKNTSNPTIYGKILQNTSDGRFISYTVEFTHGMHCGETFTFSTAQIYHHPKNLELLLRPKLKVGEKVVCKGVKGRDVPTDVVGTVITIDPVELGVWPYEVKFDGDTGWALGDEDLIKAKEFNYEIGDQIVLVCGPDNGKIAEITARSHINPLPYTAICNGKEIRLHEKAFCKANLEEELERIFQRIPPLPEPSPEQEKSFVDKAKRFVAGLILVSMVSSAIGVPIGLCIRSEIKKGKEERRQEQIVNFGNVVVVKGAKIKYYEHRYSNITFHFENQPAIMLKLNNIQRKALVRVLKDLSRPVNFTYSEQSKELLSIYRPFGE